jgi:hypothetical protein
MFREQRMCFHGDKATRTPTIYSTVKTIMLINSMMKKNGLYSSAQVFCDEQGRVSNTLQDTLRNIVISKYVKNTGKLGRLGVNCPYPLESLPVYRFPPCFQRPFCKKN